MGLRLASVAAVAVCALAISGSAFAVQRTFVASTGNDANPCSLTLPCRGFAAAAVAVDAGGEVVVLDSAGYGPFTVAKSVSIIAPTGVYAGITVFAGDGVLVAAGANDKVVLRGLTINGQGGSTGILITSAGEVHIESCSVSGMNWIGISVMAGAVHISNSVIRGNRMAGLASGGASVRVYVNKTRVAGNGGHGIVVSGGAFSGRDLAVEGNADAGILAGGPVAVVSLASSSIAGNNYGFVANAATAGYDIRAALVRVTAANNPMSGFQATASLSGSARVTITDSAAVNNGSGIVAASPNGTVEVSVSRTTSSGNVGWDLQQGFIATLRTSGNNTLTGRGEADIGGVLTPNPLR